jgi:GNAT superfamily N-acetyltransferase
MRDGVEIRPMTHDDVDATYHTTSVALYESPEERERLKNRTQQEIEHRKARQRHFLRHDPEGAWAADDDGRIVGAANAVVREGLWVLSLFAVDREYRNAGVGRALLDRALSYADGTRAAAIASAPHPAAMRRYSRAGFDLHPTLQARGRVRRDALPSGLRVREGEGKDLDLAAEVDRGVRGAAHGPDLDLMLEIDGSNLLIADTPPGRGYAVEWRGSPLVVAATEPTVARDLLRSCLALAPEGEEVEINWITGQQNWAVPVALDAGLSLSPTGPICTRGAIGPMTPYLPIGTFM